MSTMAREFGTMEPTQPIGIQENMSEGKSPTKNWSTLGAVKANKKKVMVTSGVILGLMAGAYMLRSYLKKRP